MVRIIICRLTILGILTIFPFCIANGQNGTLSNPNNGSPTLVPVPSTLPMRGAVPTTPAPQTYPSTAPSIYPNAAPPSITNAPVPTPPSAVQLGQPQLDPYQTPGFASPTPFNLFGGGPSAAPAPAGSVAFPVNPPAPNYSGPVSGPPPGNYPPSVYPNTAPGSLFPGGFNTPSFNFPSPQSMPSFQSWIPEGTLFQGGPGSFRFIQGPRLRHTWIEGGNDNDGVEVHNTDVSLALAFPTWIPSSQPFYVLPSFSLHQWDGPAFAAANAADLPPLAYSAFLDLSWQSDPNLMVGTEVGVRGGVFTDFDTFNSDSWRIMGQAFLKLRTTPTCTLKLGAMYIDRNNIKVLPAGGFLWQPTPNNRYDIFFPNPKISHYLSTVGVNDVWWYIAGEYGGGSWTITRRNATEDSIDMNQIHALIGLEWGRSDLIRSGRRFGFFEAGYVFDREVKYEMNPAHDIKPNDTFLLRAGFGY